MTSDARRIVLERDQRLSRSKLWALQRAYFDHAGASAWATNTVPHYVTCNPVLAHAYAQVFLGFLRDRRATFDLHEPFTIIELGAGSGRFAFYFLRTFMDLLRRSPFADVKIRYVMTDFTDANLRAWEAHPSLQPFFAQGVLDVARFDVEHDDALTLHRAGITLTKGSLRHPVGVIANYVFDGTPQDAFVFKKGQLWEHLVSLSVHGDIAPETPPAVDALEIKFASHPASLDYYGDPQLDAILRDYAARLEGATVLFPHTAMRCLDRLAALANGHLLMLSADRGESNETALTDTTEIAIARHGSVSLDVNYHALGAYVTQRGGRAFQIAYRHAHLCIVALALGKHTYRETQMAYDESIDRVGPDDLYALRKEVRTLTETMDLAPALALIRTSRWDPSTLDDALPALWRHQPLAPAHVFGEVVRTVMQVWQNDFPLDGTRDNAFELGLLLHAYGGHREALGLFEISLQRHGDDPRTRWNMALCHFALGEIDAATAQFAEIAWLHPTFVPTGAMQAKG